MTTEPKEAARLTKLAQDPGPLGAAVCILHRAARDEPFPDLTPTEARALLRALSAEPVGFAEWRKRAEELVRDFAYAVESNALGESDDDTPEELAADEVTARAALSAHLDAHPSGRKVERGEYERVLFDYAEAVNRATRLDSIVARIDMDRALTALDTLLAPVLTDADAEEEG